MRNPRFAMSLIVIGLALAVSACVPANYTYQQMGYPGQFDQKGFGSQQSDYGRPHQIGFQQHQPFQNSFQQHQPFQNGFQQQSFGYPGTGFYRR